MVCPQQLKDEDTCQAWTAKLPTVSDTNNTAVLPNYNKNIHRTSIWQSITYISPFHECCSICTLVPLSCKQPTFSSLIGGVFVALMPVMIPCKQEHSGSAFRACHANAVAARPGVTLRCHCPACQAGRRLRSVWQPCGSYYTTQHAEKERGAGVLLRNSVTLRWCRERTLSGSM